MSKKTGVNDPCPCGSGKKFKKCHRLRSTLPPDIWDKADMYFTEHHRREAARKAEFGEVRAPVSAEHMGKRVVAVGNRIYWGKWRFFTDFLDPFVRGALGVEWGQAELRKPEAERHTLLDWRIKAWQQMNGVPPDSTGVYSTALNGFVAAFFGFAYDLYTVADNNRLDGVLLSRLKHRDQFQGARHELFAEATCLRAGFSIEHENEKDPSKRHVEFVATFKATGQKLSVEAKSKQRPGVQGRKGNRESPERANLRFGSLIQDAARKENAHPLVVFVDTNLPLANADHFFELQSRNPVVPSRVMVKVLDLVTRQNSGTDPYSLLVFTNHPDHYAQEAQADPRRHLFGVFAKRPAPSSENLPALLAICHAANLYGNIPKDFPITPGGNPVSP